MEDLNRIYRSEPALHEADYDPACFEWIDCNDSDQNVISFMRKGRSVPNPVLIICNFAPVPRFNYRVGLPIGGFWREILNTDSLEHGGSGHGNLGGVEAAPLGHHGRPYLVNLTLPPLGALFFRSELAGRRL